MEVFFCDRCSCMITEGQLADGDAIAFGTLNFCEACGNTDEVRRLISQSTGLVAAVQEGGAGASSNEMSEHVGAKAGRKTSSSGRTAGTTSQQIRRHPSPGHMGTVKRIAPSTGRHSRVRVRGRSKAIDTQQLLVFVGAAAVVTFVVIGALLLLASSRRVSYSSSRERCVACHTLDESHVGTTLGG